MYVKIGDPFSQHVKDIFCDGKKLELCTEFDTDRGTATCHKRDIQYEFPVPLCDSGEPIFVYYSGAITYTLNNNTVVSASKIKLFRTCERKYYYTHIQKPDHENTNEVSLAALVGSTVHRAIELRYKNGSEFNPVAFFQEKIADVVEEAQERGTILKGELWFTKSLRDGKDMLRKFDWDRFHPKELEYYFKLPFPNADTPIAYITGYIDLIDNAGVVVDHKSDNRQPNKTELDNNIQFLIYAWAYHATYGDMPYDVVWNHLRLGKLIPVNVFYQYELKLKQLEYDILALLSRGKEITDYPRKIMDKECRNYCPFFKECYGLVESTVTEDEEDE